MRTQDRYAGMSAAEIRAAALNEYGPGPDIGTPSQTGQPYDPGWKALKEFSILRLIRSVVDEKFGNTSNCLEREVSQDIKRRVPPNITLHGGECIPMRLPVEPIGRALVSMRDTSPTVLTAGTEHYGKESVFTQPQEFIELLRNSMKVRALGARVLSGLTGNIAFPRQTAAGTLQWVGEAPGEDVTDSAMQLDQLVLSPKSASSTTGYSRKLLTQSSLDVENLVRQDLAQIAGLGIDKVCIQGGGPNEPSGILATEGIGSVEMGTSGALPTYGKCLELVSALDAANVVLSTPGFLCDAELMGACEKTPILAGFPKFLWERQNGVNALAGYRAEYSNNCPGNLTKEVGSTTITDLHALIFGNWSDLIIGEWGVLEILVDPYRLKKQGIVEITSFVMVDVGLRYTKSFAASLDCKLSD
jgi:HK97 family phage major capsid protein